MENDLKVAIKINDQPVIDFLKRIQGKDLVEVRKKCIEELDITEDLVRYTQIKTEIDLIDKYLKEGKS